MAKKVIMAKKDIIVWIIAILVWIAVFVVGGIAIFSYSGNKSEEVKKYDTCNICHGEMKCAVCGKSGPYCENAQYGAGDDHYCLEHWADCCEWHENNK